MVVFLSYEGAGSALPLRTVDDRTAQLPSFQSTVQLRRLAGSNILSMRGNCSSGLCGSAFEGL